VDAAVGSVRETLKEQGLPSGGPFDKGSGVTFVQARTAHESLGRGVADQLRYEGYNAVFAAMLALGEGRQGRRLVWLA